MFRERNHDLGQNIKTNAQQKQSTTKLAQATATVLHAKSWKQKKGDGEKKMCQRQAHVKYGRERAQKILRDT